MAVRILNFAILKKGLNDMIKAKINYGNKIGNHENFKLNRQQNMKYIKFLQPHNETDKYSSLYS